MTVEAEAMGAKASMGTFYTEPRVVGYPLTNIEQWSELREITDAVSIDSATSVTKLKNALHNKVVVGNVSTYMLQKGQPERVKGAALSCLRQGTAVLSPACGISPSTPLANLQAMAKAVNEFDPSS